MAQKIDILSLVGKDVLSYTIVLLSPPLTYFNTLLYYNLFLLVYPATFLCGMIEPLIYAQTAAYKTDKQHAPMRRRLPVNSCLISRIRRRLNRNSGMIFATRKTFIRNIRMFFAGLLSFPVNTYSMNGKRKIVAGKCMTPSVPRRTLSCSSRIISAEHRRNTFIYIISEKYL